VSNAGGEEYFQREKGKNVRNRIRNFSRSPKVLKMKPLGGGGRSGRGGTKTSKGEGGGGMGKIYVSSGVSGGKLTLRMGAVRRGGGGVNVTTRGRDKKNVVQSLWGGQT